MRQLITLLILVVLFASCSQRDSKGPSEDTRLAERIISAHQDSIYSDPAETRRHMQRIQQTLTDSSAVNRLELYVAVTYLIQHDQSGFEKALQRVSCYVQRHPDDHAVAGLLWNHRAVASLSQGNRDSAAVFFRRSYDELLASRDTLKACDVSINLSSIYREKGQLALAAATLQNAMLLSNGPSHDNVRFALLYMLGAIYGDMSSFDRAEMYFREATKLFVKASLNDRFQFYNSRGSCRFYNKRYAAAQRDFGRASVVAKKLGNPVYEAIAQSNTGEVLAAQGESRKALPLLLKSEKAFTALGVGNATSEAYLNDLIASVMLQSNDINEARRRFLATDTAALKGNMRYEMIHYERLADFYSRTADYAKAYQAQKTMRSFESRLRSTLFREQMADAQQRYQRDTKVISQQAEIAHQRDRVRVLAVVVIAVIVLAVMLFIILQLVNRRRQQTMLHRFNRELTSLSLQNVRNRLSPHFIMNILGREIDPDNAGVARLIRFIRQNLMLVDRKIIPLADELDFTDNYIQLEAKALSRDFDYQLIVDPAIDVSRIFVPAMMVHIFVENAVKHGLRGRQGRLFLHISVHKDPGAILITIDNNGSGGQSKAAGTHTGLKTIQQTVELYNHNNNRQVSIAYGPADDGVWHVAITIPDGYKFEIKDE